MYEKDFSQFFPSMAHIDVWLMFDRMWREKRMFYFLEDQSPAPAPGSSVLGQIASAAACWIRNSSGGSWCVDMWGEDDDVWVLGMPFHLSSACFPSATSGDTGTGAPILFSLRWQSVWIWVNTVAHNMPNPGAAGVTHVWVSGPPSKMVLKKVPA